MQFFVSSPPLCDASDLPNISMPYVEPTRVTVTEKRKYVLVPDANLTSSFKIHYLLHISKLVSYRQKYPATKKQFRVINTAQLMKGLGAGYDEEHEYVTKVTLFS